MDAQGTEITPAIIVGPNAQHFSLLVDLPLEQSVRLILASTPGTLLASLKAARSLGCTHAISLVAGTVCSTEDLTLLIGSARQNPSGVALGYRVSIAPSSLFTRMSDLFIRLETGLRLRDPRGVRVYPLCLIDAIPASRKTDLTDMELLVRAVWSGCPIIEIALAADPGRATDVHSGPNEILTHFRLLARALSGWPHPKYDFETVHHRVPLRRSPLPWIAGKCARCWRRMMEPSFWRGVLQWFNPLRAWRELREGGGTRSEIAAGVAAGVFIGTTPAWGFHTALSLYVAKRLHLHPLAVVAGSHISAPPLGAFLAAAGMWLGHVLLHQTRPTWNDVTPFHGKFVAHALPLLVDWMLGAAIIGTTLAITVFIVANFLFRFLERREGSETVSVNKSTV